MLHLEQPIDARAPPLHSQAVRLPLTAAFVEESARVALRFCCEDCGHFERTTERCRHDWPVELHRRARYERRSDGDVVFCKEFELS
jgi:hypothetical protein